MVKGVFETLCFRSKAVRVVLTREASCIGGMF